MVTLAAEALTPERPCGSPPPLPQGEGARGADGSAAALKLHLIEACYTEDGLAPLMWRSEREQH
ncbi:MAG: hypothetical protein Kow00124_31450 [Anaerolineae bacterium]